MNATKRYNQQKRLRIRRARSRIHGTDVRPRLSVFRSLRHMELQLIDDVLGKTLVSVHDMQLKAKKADASKTAATAKAYALGALLAEKAKAKGITTAVFDRRGAKFHGRVAAVAKGAREGGLKV